MATNLRSDDTIQVRIPQGGGSVRDVPLSEINEYISTEETSSISDLEDAVGTYGGSNDLSTDLSAAESDIDDLEAQVGDYDPTSTGSTITADLDTAETNITALEAVANEYAASVATATAATATYTTDETNPADGSTVVVNDQTYRFKTVPAQANDILIGGSADATLAFLVLAINGTGTGDGSDYYAGTAAATGVTAGDVSSHATTVTANTKGVAANAFPKSASTDPDSHIDLDAGGGGTAFSGGVDGTVAAQGKVYVTDTALYVAVDDCTATDSNWETITYDS